MSTISDDEPPALPTTRSAGAFSGVAGPTRPGRLRGQVSTGLVARPWTGWVLLVLGAVAFVGSLGPWVETAEVTVNGGVLDGRWSALFSLLVLAVGVLLVLGLGYRCVCVLGLGAAVGTVAFGVSGYHAGRDVLASAPPAAWGVHLCVAAGIGAGLIAAAATLVRAPYRVSFDRPVRHAPSSVDGSSARSEPVVALVAAAASAAVSFDDYPALQRLTRGYVIHGGEFYSVAWGLCLVLAASIVGVGVAVRGVSRRGVIVPKADRGV